MEMVMEFDDEFERREYEPDGLPAEHYGIPTVMDVKCVWCDAGVGMKCRNPNGRPRGGVHKARKNNYRHLLLNAAMIVESPRGAESIVVKYQDSVNAIAGEGITLPWRHLYFKGWKL